MLLGLDRLMQAVTVTAARLQMAGELINDDHLAILHHVLVVLLVEEVRLQGVINQLRNLHILRINQRAVLHPHLLLHPYHPRLRQRSLVVLSVPREERLVIIVGAYHLADQRLEVVIVGAVRAGLAGDDQRRSRLINENAVGFINDAVVQFPLRQLRWVCGHIVAQVVKPQLAVLNIRDISGVHHPSLRVRHGVLDIAGAHAQSGEYLPHPFRLPAHQEVIGRHQMSTLARQRIQIQRHRRRQRLAFTRLHLHYHAVVEGDATSHLHPERPLRDDSIRRLPHACKRLRQQVVEVLSCPQPLPELPGLRPQLLIRELSYLILKCQHQVGRPYQTGDLALVRVNNSLYHIPDCYHNTHKPSRRFAIARTMRSLRAVKLRGKPQRCENLDATAETSRVETNNVRCPPFASRNALVQPGSRRTVPT